jgi:hypothetical protein
MLVNRWTVYAFPYTWNPALPATQLPAQFPSCSLQHKFLCYGIVWASSYSICNPCLTDGEGGVVWRVGKSQRRQQMSDERSYLSARRWRLKTRAQRNAVRILHESYWYSETQISNFLLSERREIQEEKKIEGGNRIVSLKVHSLFFRTSKAEWYCSKCHVMQ